MTEFVHLFSWNLDRNGNPLHLATRLLCPFADTAINARGIFSKASVPVARDQVFQPGDSQYAGRFLGDFLKGSRSALYYAADFLGCIT